MFFFDGESNMLTNIDGDNRDLTKNIQKQDQKEQSLNRDKKRPRGYATDKSLVLRW